MSKWDCEKDNLEKLIKDNISYEEIGRMYNCTGANIKKVAKLQGIELEPRRKINECEKFNSKKEVYTSCLNCNNEFISNKNGKGGKTKFCSQTCSAKYNSKMNYEKYKLDNSTVYGQSNMSSYKKHFLIEQENKCSICEMLNIWNGKELIFILDHIDGNADNNERNNLRLICPNCDSQLDTYKSKNKNSARSKYRQTIKVEDCE